MHNVEMHGARQRNFSRALRNLRNGAVLGTRVRPRGEFLVVNRLEQFILLVFHILSFSEKGIITVLWCQPNFFKSMFTASNISSVSITTNEKYDPLESQSFCKLYSTLPVVFDVANIDLKMFGSFHRTRHSIVDCVR